LLLTGLLFDFVQFIYRQMLLSKRTSSCCYCC